MICTRLIRVALPLLFALGCGDVPAHESARCAAGADTRVVVIFWDQSTSAMANQSAAAVFADSLNNLVATALKCPGSRVAGFLVHARTRGKAHRVREGNTLKLPPTSGPRNKVVRDSLRYEMELGKLIEQTREHLAALIQSTSLPPELAAQTDLLGTFEVLSEELADAPDHAVKQVYYFSDMYESMTGPGRRDFDRRPPRDFSEAEAWARADADYVRKNTSVVPSRFADVEVRVLTEGLGNRADADQVRRYWEVLFAELGFRRVRFN